MKQIKLICFDCGVKYGTICGELSQEKVKQVMLSGLLSPATNAGRLSSC